MGHVFKHLRTINAHRWLVLKGCFKVGLYWQGLTHDLSKYSPTEFRVGAKYFLGNESPNNAERVEKGYSSSWLHHKGRNKHHYEYWVDYSVNIRGAVLPVKMPKKYFVEMIIDRISAAKIYNKDKYTDSKSLDYYMLGKDKIIIHEETAEDLEFVLRYLAKYGENATFKFLKEVYLKNEEFNKQNYDVV